MPVSVAFNAFYRKDKKAVAGNPPHDPPTPFVKDFLTNGALEVANTRMRCIDTGGQPWQFYIRCDGNAAWGVWAPGEHQKRDQADKTQADTGASPTGRKLKAFMLALSGIDDRSDAAACNTLQLAAGSLLPGELIDIQRQELKRPGIFFAAADQETFTNRAVTTRSLALGLALMEKVRPKVRRPPVMSPHPRIRNPGFLSLNFSADGSLADEWWVEVAELEKFDGTRKQLELFRQAIAKRDDRFEATITVTDGSKVSLQFQGFPVPLYSQSPRPEVGGEVAAVVEVFANRNTAAVVSIATLAPPAAPDQPSGSWVHGEGRSHLESKTGAPTPQGESPDTEVALLLTGLDNKTELAALASYEAWVARQNLSGPWPQALHKIEHAPRPLVARFDVGQPKDWYKTMASCVAAAFFESKRLL